MCSVFDFCETYKKRRSCVLSKHLTLTFSVGLPEKINYPVPASHQVRFQPLRVIERFCVDSSNFSAAIVEHSSNDLEFFIDRTFRASISSIPTLCKLINAFPFFPRNSGRRGLTLISPGPRIS